MVFFVRDKPEMANIWLKRHENRKAVKQNFRIRKLIDDFKTAHPAIGGRLDSLYERTIDYGAHPNVSGTLMNLEHTKKDGTHTFNYNYLSGMSDSFWFCLKSVPTVGIVGLEVFNIIFETRCELLEIPERIRALSKDL